MSNVLYVVIPCYNEEEVLPNTSDALIGQIKEMIGCGIISEESKILFVDDGSSDKTWSLISKISNSEKSVEGIKLSHNQGHQNALFAGMMYVKNKCDCMISIDADLQDDITVFPEFIKKFNEGCDVVYGVRNERKKDSAFKRFTAQGFYKFMNLMGAETVYNHADYRLMSRRALEALSEYKEVNLF